MTLAKKVRQIASRLRGRKERGKRLHPTLHCSFCGKTQHDVEKLIAGPAVFICNECVAECNKWIAKAPDAPGPRSQVHTMQDLDSFSNERLILWLKTERRCTSTLAPDCRTRSISCANARFPGPSSERRSASPAKPPGTASPHSCGTRLRGPA